MKDLVSIIAVAVTAPFAFAANYEAEIAPILRTYCAGCHNDTDLEGDLSMETFAALRKGGEKGDPLKADEKGPLFMRVIEATGKGKMPPKDEPQLTAEELATLKKWIAAGAAGPAKDESLFKKLVVPKTAPRDGRAMPVTAAAFSPDSMTLAVGKGNAVEVLNPADGAVVRRLETPGKVNAVHFSTESNSSLRRESSGSTAARSSGTSRTVHSCANLAALAIRFTMRSFHRMERWWSPQVMIA